MSLAIVYTGLSLDPVVMALYKISDRYPNYQDVYFEGGDLKGRVVYSSERHEAGQVSELLLDESDRLKYLVVDLKGHKRVLVPVRRLRENNRRKKYLCP